MVASSWLSDTAFLMTLVVDDAISAATEVIRRCGADKSDHRHRRLLRARRERPCSGRCAAQQRDEIAPSQLIGLHSVPASQGRFAGYRIGEEQSAGYTRLFTLGRGPGRRFAERRSFAPQ